MLRQIFHNLVNNSLLAKAPDAVSISIEVSATVDEVVIDVTDDGPGVPVALRQSLFDAYVTSRSTGEKEKGMGLGLTISRQIAIDHGGSLVLLHSSGQGTTMRLKLPLASGVVTENRDQP
jgi:C4-dicarboxylate-specific signal transduction histidine kinase